MPLLCTSGGGGGGGRGRRGGGRPRRPGGCATQRAARAQRRWQGASGALRSAWLRLRWGCGRGAHLNHPQADPPVAAHTLLFEFCRGSGGSTHVAPSRLSGRRGGRGGEHARHARGVRARAAGRLRVKAEGLPGGGGPAPSPPASLHSAPSTPAHLSCIRRLWSLPWRERDLQMQPAADVSRAAAATAAGRSAAAPPLPQLGGRERAPFRGSPLEASVSSMPLPSARSNKTSAARSSAQPRPIQRVREERVACTGPLAKERWESGERDARECRA